MARALQRAHTQSTSSVAAAHVGAALTYSAGARNFALRLVTHLAKGEQTMKAFTIAFGTYAAIFAVFAVYCVDLYR